MEKKEKVDTILTRIREVVERFGASLFIVWRGALMEGTGYITLPAGKELAFEFSFTNSGYDVDFLDDNRAVSKIRPFLDYEDRAELEALLKRIETRMKEIQ